jgi:hypothetical protein
MNNILNPHMKHIFTTIILLSCIIASGQSHSKRALYLGNSYTYVNNLPLITASVAKSTGDTLIYNSNAPGGYTLQGHSTNATSLAMIAAGNWDYVILQEQSQMPSFPISQVITDVFPYAHILDSIITADNPCGETVFYMTWGRKNGDATNCGTWPPVCTYTGMDSLLNLRYRMMADDNNAVVSPVGAVWRYIRQNFPLIELYQSDESHPSLAGSYAAACCFYTTMFRKDPTHITFDTTLVAADAANIRSAVKAIVYDSLMNWHIGAYDPLASFTYLNQGSNQIAFTNISSNASTYYWDFGDGDTSTAVNPAHTYAVFGSYNVMLIATHCQMSDTIFSTIYVDPTGIDEAGVNKYSWSISPNPASSTLAINHPLPANVNYCIFNNTGAEVKRGTFDETSSNINVSLLPDGLYLLQLFDNGKTIGQRKFVKSGN